MAWYAPNHLFSCPYSIFLLSVPGMMSYAGAGETLMRNMGGGQWHKGCEDKWGVGDVYAG